MSVAAILLLLSTSLYGGFQWTIRIVVYPQFASVPAEAFTRYERTHQRLVTRAVGPLFLLAGGSAIGAFVARPGLASGTAGVAVAGVLVLTGLAAVPQHRRLTERFDRVAYARLMRVDTARLALSALACAAAVAYAVSDG